MLRILIETLPHGQQRYDTVGDWFFDEDGTWRIKVSETGNWKQELLLGLHELVEMALCQSRDITSKMVDDFDLYWAGSEDEPGDDFNAPYYLEHQVASGIERLMAAELRVDWAEYERTVGSL